MKDAQVINSTREPGLREYSPVCLSELSKKTIKKISAFPAPSQPHQPHQFQVDLADSKSLTRKRLARLRASILDQLYQQRLSQEVPLRGLYSRRRIGNER